MKLIISTLYLNKEESNKYLEAIEQLNAKLISSEKWKLEKMNIYLHEIEFNKDLTFNEITKIKKLFINEKIENMWVENEDNKITII